jgi:hypothetical protein
MQIVNRGFLTIKPKKPFFDWANNIDKSVSFSEEDEVEGTNFLIEEILKNELSMISEDESIWPPISMETFLTWFDVDLGTIVFDLEKSDLKRSKID